VPQGLRSRITLVPLGGKGGEGNTLPIPGEGGKKKIFDEKHSFQAGNQLIDPHLGERGEPLRSKGERKGEKNQQIFRGGSGVKRICFSETIARKRGGEREEGATKLISLSYKSKRKEKEGERGVAYFNLPYKPRRKKRPRLDHRPLQGLRQKGEGGGVASFINLIRVGRKGGNVNSFDPWAWIVIVRQSRE